MVKQWYDRFNSLPGNLTNLIFFILGIAVTLIGGWVSRDYKEISVMQPEAPVIVFDSNAVAPRLRLIDDQGGPITGTVFIETITVWNSGSLPIENTDIRVPVRFSVSPISRMIDTTILRANYPSEASFGLVPIEIDEDGTDIATIQLNWTHFDPRFGATIQFMYEAEEDAHIEASGHIQGIWPRQFRVISRPSNNPLEIVPVIVLSVGSLVFAFFSATQFFEILGSLIFKKATVDKWKYLKLGLVLILFVVTVLLLLYTAQVLGPPIGL